MSEHTQVKCSKADCGGTCWPCTISICAVCGLCEGAQTSECPGEQVGYEMVVEIYEGNMDFKGGQWVKECSPCSPAFYRRKA